MTYMRFVDPNRTQLKALGSLLKSEGLCYTDLNDVSLIKIKPNGNNEIIAGYGLEIFEGNALLRSVVVIKPMRSVGLGRAIINDALKTAQESGIRNIFLLTTTADRFFSKLGFKEITRDSVPDSIANTTEFKTFCPDTAVCMKFEF